MPIVIVANATPTGSFTDGYATAATEAVSASSINLRGATHHCLCREDVQPRLCQVATYDRLRFFPCVRKIVSEKYANDCCMKYFAGPIRF